MKNKRIFLPIAILMFLISSILNVYANSDISKDEAKKIAMAILKSNFGVILNDNDNITTKDENDESINKAIWCMKFNKNNEQFSVEIDKKTRRLLKFNKEKENAKEPIKKINEQQAKNIAEKFAQKMNPNEIKETKLEDYQNYDFAYKRNANNMNFMDNEILIGVDEETGKINHYSFTWDNNVKYEDIDKITKDIRQTSFKYINDTFNIKIDETDNCEINKGKEEYHENKNVWEVRIWKMKNEKDIGVELFIDKETGKVVGFNKVALAEHKTIQKVSKDEASKIADEFIKKLNNSELKNIRLKSIKVDDEKGYLFNYVRTVNNIDFDRNGVQLGIDKENGKIIRYLFDWNDNIKFEESKNVISKEKAKEIFKNNMKLNLYYTGVKKEDNILGEIKLIYKNTGWDSIDGKKGNSMDDSEEEIKNSNKKIKELTKEEKEKIFKNSQKTEQTNKEISKEEACKIMKEKIKEIMNIDVNLKDISYAQNDDSEKAIIRTYWKASFETKDSKIEGTIAIDSKNKKILELNNYEMLKNNGSSMTYEQGYNKALEIIKKYYPDKIMNLDFRNESDDDNIGYHSYCFDRKENNVQFADNNISIELIDNKIYKIKYNWNENNIFPDKNKIINEEKAKDMILENHEIRLRYIVDEKTKDNAIITYELEPLERYYDGIDAINGKPLNLDDEEIKNK